MINPYSADDAALRAVARNDLYAAQRAYLAMSPADRRAYAAAHPDFTSTTSSIVPESIAFAMADAEASGGPDAAQRVWDDYTHHRIAAMVAADRGASRMPIGERVIMSGAYTVAAGVVAAVACPTGYVAVGPHGALVAATAIACAWCVAVLYRLSTGVR